MPNPCRGAAFHNEIPDRFALTRPSSFNEGKATGATVVAIGLCTHFLLFIENLKSV